MKFSTFIDLSFVMCLLLFLPASDPRAKLVVQTGNQRDFPAYDGRGETHAELHVLVTESNVHWYADASYSVEAVLPKGKIIVPLGCAYTSTQEGLFTETWAKIGENRYVLMSRSHDGNVFETYVTGGCP